MSEILKTDNPRKQKALGRKVGGFDVAKWDAEGPAIMKEGLRLKFTQNDELREKLFATTGTTLVEAAPGDAKWGIGRAINSPDALDRTKWRGQNILGKLLTEVRDELMAEANAKSSAIAEVVATSIPKKLEEELEIKNS